MVRTTFSVATFNMHNLQDADVLGLQEVWSQSALESRDDPADPQAPVIAVSIKSFSWPVLNFQVQLRDDEPAMEVFVVHLKSKLPTQVGKEAWYKKSSATYPPHQQALGDGISTIRRTAEAVAVRVLLNGVMRATETRSSFSVT
ncbi:hypothetical protein HNP40_001504 [Mycobacteroides chelonae]|nr:hypothetical protein [Mycobacteroides chelonae]